MISSDSDMEEDKASDLFKSIIVNDTKMFKDCVRYFKERSIHIDDILDVHGHTALMYAANKGNTQYIEILLDQANVDINKTDKDGYAALSIAIQANQTEAFDLLMCRGSDYNIPCTHLGFTPLMIACARNQSNIVKKLLSKPDIDINHQCSEHRDTALHWCAYREFKECAEILLDDPRCDKAVVNRSGNTAEALARLVGNHQVADLIANHELMIMDM